MVWLVAFSCGDIFAQGAPEVVLQKIRVSPLSDSVKVGELVNFQIIVSNTGKLKFISLQVTDTYNKSFMEYVSAQPEPDSIDTDQGFISWNNLVQQFGPLSPGQSLTLSITFKAIAISATAPAIDTATISGYDENSNPLTHAPVSVYVNIAQSCALDIYEPNGSVKNAASITVGARIRAYICPIGDVDYYSCVLQEPGNYMCKLSSLPDDFNLYVYDNAGGLIGQSTNTGTTPEMVPIQVEKSLNIIILVSGVRTFSYDKPYILEVSHSEVGGGGQIRIPPGGLFPMFGSGLPTGSPRMPAQAMFYLDNVAPGNLLGTGNVLPDGRLACTVPIPDDVSGDHSIITDVVKGNDVLGEFRTDVMFQLPDVNFDLWIDDAWMYRDGEKPVVNKIVKKSYGFCGYTKVDVVCKISPELFKEDSALVQVKIEGDMLNSPDQAFVRSGFGGVLTPVTFYNDLGGKYHVQVDGIQEGNTQVVFRFHIPPTLSAPDYISVWGSAYKTDWTLLSEITKPRLIHLVKGASVMVLANRNTLFRDFDETDVAHFLGKVYQHSQSSGKYAPRDQRAIIYYVDQYWQNTSVVNWDNSTVDYTSETSANYVSILVKYVLLENYNSFEDTPVSFILILGNDEQIPMYRLKDPSNEEDDWAENFPGGDKGNPAIRCCLEDYYLTDDYYAYISGGPVAGDWKTGNLDLRCGRIIGDSVQDMEQLYLSGLMEEGHSYRAVMASVSGWELGYVPDDPNIPSYPDFINVPARLVNHGIQAFNDTETPQTIDVLSYPASWATGFQNAANAGMDIFFIGGHDSYTKAVIPQDDFDPSDIPSKYTRFDDDHPIVMIVGCHGGLPVPNIGWGGGVNHSMVYSVIHNGARAYFGASGFSYGSPGSLYRCLWAELFNQYLFYYLLQGTNNTHTLGTAIRKAKDYYPFGVGSKDYYDKKTVTEYNLFGVPWQIQRYPYYIAASKPPAAQRKSEMPAPLAKEMKLMLAPHKVTKLASNTYQQQFIVDIASWEAKTMEGFDIIEIPDGLQQYIPDAPLLPALTKYSIALPQGGKIISVTVDDYTTQSIGQFNIPTVLLGPWTTTGLTLSDETKINEIYPPDIARYHEGGEGHYLFSVFPVRHNPTTNETIFHDHMRVTITYEAPAPYGILNFIADDAIFSNSSYPSFSAQVFNMGDTSQNLNGTLTIKDEDANPLLPQTNLSLNLAPGTIYNLSVSYSDLLAEGVYDGELSISNAVDAPSTATTNFSVAKAYLSGLSALYSIKDNKATFSVNVTNLTKEPGSVYLNFLVSKEDDTPTSTIETNGLIVNGESSEVISGTWIPDTITSGTFNVEAVASFDDAPLDSIKIPFNIYQYPDLLEALLSHLMGRKELPLTDRVLADVNQDGLLDVADVVAIIEAKK